MSILLAALSVSYILIIFNLTDFIVEYADLIGLSKIVKSFEYKSKKQAGDWGLTYAIFIAETYPCFLTKLLSCPFCLGCWLSILSSLFIGEIKYAPAIGFLSIAFYFFFLSLYKFVNKPTQ